MIISTDLLNHVFVVYKSEEEFHNEKKQLEKIIHDKDLTIYDQQVLITEKEEEIKKIGKYFCSN
jgi:hypothetical protein